MLFAICVVRVVNILILPTIVIYALIVRLDDDIFA